MKRITFTTIFVISALFIISGTGLCAIWYVDGGVSDAGDGTSWLHAFKEIRDGIDAASDNDQVWVKEGTYTLYQQIFINKHIKLYGGFIGDETDLSERDWVNNITTVDGNSDVRCFQIDGQNTQVTINGFNIVNGRGDSRGGGIRNSSGYLHVENCRFSGNVAFHTTAGGRSFGGAISNFYARYNDHWPLITNCVFWNNSAGFTGGAIANYYSTHSTIIDCTFSGNYAPSGGGAIANFQSIPKVTNCILWDNQSYEIYNEQSTSIVSYSVVEGGYPGAGNIEVDPLFVDADNGDLTLLSDSPALNIGAYIAGRYTPNCTSSFPSDTLPPAGAVHAFNNVIWPANNKMVQVNISGQVRDELSMMRDGVGVGISWAELRISGMTPIPLNIGNNGQFKMDFEFKAVKGAEYSVELWAADTNDTPNSGIVDSTSIRVEENMGKEGK